MITRDSAAATEERSNQASHLEYPYLLRRAPAILAALLTLIIGSALLIVAAHLHDSHPFASGVFVNVSSPVLLFAPLAFLTTTFGRQIVRSENARNVKIEQLTTQVKNVREDFDSALAAIAHGVTERMAADRKPIEDDIRAIVQAPMSHSIGNALRHGIENGYLSSRGPRVRIPGTNGYVRLMPGEQQGDALAVFVEMMNGDVLESFGWSVEDDAEVFGYKLAKELEKSGAYPGDIVFDVGSIFFGIHEAVSLGFLMATGAGGVTAPVGPILELTGRKWAVTDFWLTTREWPHYQVTLDRLDELDWDQHIRQKHDMDIAGFREAMDVAMSLIAAGHLTIPNYEEGFTTRMY